jgi:hypothetical protein
MNFWCRVHLFDLQDKYDNMKAEQEQQLTMTMTEIQ